MLIPVILNLFMMHTMHAANGSSRVGRKCSFYFVFFFHFYSNVNSFYFLICLKLDI